ncbi:MAG: prephenate dehydrogenase [Firmicutes bacterium]|nr:prephenate dehydrogenase [Bacillota bacterium]
MSDDIKILIVGLGLIGGSYAQGLSKKGYTVYAIDKNPNSIKYGVDNNIIKEFNGSNNDLIKESDLIILSLYPKDNVNWIKDNKQFFKENVVITDVSGIKVAIVDEIQQLLDNAEFVPSHPMAGREKSGVENADYNIFKDANFLITPTESNTKEAILLIKELAEALEFSNIEIISPSLHDEMIGYLSQLTHVIAISLMNSKDTEHMIRYTGDSFRDLTRIAKINENLWSELFILNKDILADNIDKFILEMSKFKEILVNEDINEMKKKMISSTERRKLFDKR